MAARPGQGRRRRVRPEVAAEGLLDVRTTCMVGSHGDAGSKRTR